ncbi:hypothetical protein [Dokdonella fugitiva]|jgi:hypothetical protein|uniref:Uncharacterized protein n=1 Tax=Dokdonella fugitiva TaxID=328517 RepID=A0A4R2IAZ8_9GAMM|nr:hypothetical protein [Dokdonella fugitiva]MBA8885250.1 hypothetical protein [Dokdonella fugitiva]TCO41661.1 hypothetical protein EV148_10211 [Dokdonella fugitiva]
MNPEWRIVAVVSTPILNTAVRDVCDAEPAHYRSRKLPSRCESLAHWELMVNYAQGELSGAASAGILLRTLRSTTAARVVDLEVPCD